MSKEAEDKNTEAAEVPASPRATGSAPSVEACEMRECIECLFGVVEDMLPQIGGIVLQDYERLNRGLILASLIRKRWPNDKIHQ